MHKEDLDTKIGDKFLVENTLLTQKVKPQKEKKTQKVSSPTPKKLKKKVHFSNTKEPEKDLDKEKDKEKILQQKNNQIRPKIPQTQIPKKSEKTDENESPVLNQKKAKILRRIQKKI